MSRRQYDPLDCIPSPDAVREKLTQTLTLAERLRLLLDFAERIHRESAPSMLEPPASRQAVPNAH